MSAFLLLFCLATVVAGSWAANVSNRAMARQEAAERNLMHLYEAEDAFYRALRRQR